MKRRPLQFQSLEDAVTDARRLLTNGYDRAGAWGLAQNLEHLAMVFDKSLDGFGDVPKPLGFKMFGSWLIKPIMLKTGKMPAGVNGPASLMPTGASDDNGQLGAFESAVSRFNTATSFQPSPFLGKLTGDEWRRLHCIHAAHHLSFLVPKG